MGKFERPKTPKSREMPNAVITIIGADYDKDVLITDIAEIAINDLKHMLQHNKFTCTQSVYEDIVAYRKLVTHANNDVDTDASRSLNTLLELLEVDDEN